MTTRLPRACSAPYCPGVFPCSTHPPRDRRASAVVRGYGAAHQAWAQDIFALDHGICRGCGDVPEQPHADHVIRKELVADPFDAANGQTLCVRCHSFKTAKESHDHQFGQRLRAVGSKTGQSAPQGWRHMRI